MKAAFGVRFVFDLARVFFAAPLRAPPCFALLFFAAPFFAALFFAAPLFFAAFFLVALILSWWVIGVHSARGNTYPTRHKVQCLWCRAIGEVSFFPLEMRSHRDRMLP